MFALPRPFASSRRACGPSPKRSGRGRKRSGLSPKRPFLSPDARFPAPKASFPARNASAPARRRAGLTLTAFALLLLTGCGRHDTGGAGTATPTDNRLRVSMSASPTTFDPAALQDVPTTQLLQQVFEGLVQWSPDNKVVPCLAEKWEISPDGKTYTFHLRKGVKFQNGTPVTAEDAAWSLRRALDPKIASPVAITYLGDIVGAKAVADGKSKDLTGVKVIDPQTLAVTIQSPKAYWIDTLTYCTGWIVSRAATEKKNFERLTDDDVKAGIATGPFKLTRYVKDSEVDLDANKDYWDGAPTLAGQTHKIVVDTGTRHSLFASGQLDIMRDLQFGDLISDRRDPNLKSQIKLWPRAGVAYLACNGLVYKPFADSRVRRALAMATDKEKLRRVVTEDVWEAAPDLLPRGIPGFDPNFQGVKYDPAAAKTLLASAGYANGKGLPPLDIYYKEKDDISAKLVDQLRQMYAETLGMTVQARPLEWGTLLSQINKNTAIPASSLSWYADYLDPQDFYSLLLVSTSPENHYGYKNANLDKLCAQADIEQDPKKRMTLYRQVGKIASDDASRIPLLYNTDPELVSPHVQGLEDCLMGHLPFKHVTLK